MTAVAEEATSTPRLRARRHPWRIVVGVVVALLVVQLVAGMLANEAFQWDVVARYVGSASILSGLWATIWLTAVTVVAGFLLGTVLAVMRLTRNPVLQAVSWGFTWIFRSIPLLVLLLFTFNIGYLLPEIRIGLPLFGPFLEIPTNQVVTPLLAALLALTIHEAAYSAEIIRGGILSVDGGQVEAASALGMSSRRTMVRIVIPQAMRAIVPAAGNQLIAMLKGTSMVSVIAVGDLLYSAQSIYNRSFQIVPLLVVAVLWYIVMTTLLSIVQYYVERRFARGAVRSLPPTPLQRLRRTLATLPSRTDRS